MNNEAIENGAVTIVPSETPTETFQLTALGKVEKIVYEYAKIVAAKQHIKPEHFDVRLVTKLNGIWAMTGGDIVQIFLLWPDAQPEINTHLRSAFSTMRRFSMRRSMELVPIALIKKHHAEHKKFCKEKFGEMGEILPDLISRQRLRMRQTTITTLEDAKTGEHIIMTNTTKWQRFDSDYVGMWLELSRVVRDKHHEEIFEDDLESETPVLDQTLREIQA